MEVFCIAKFKATYWNKDKLREKLFKLSQSNKEAGCEFYIPTEQISHNVANGKEDFDFVFIEKFKSEEDFNSHTREMYVKDFFETNEDLIKDSNICLFRPIWRD